MKLDSSKKKVLLEIYKINESLLEKYRLLPDDKVSKEIKEQEEYITKLLNDIDINLDIYNEVYKYINSIYPYLTPDLVDDLVYEEGKSLVTKKTINMIRDYIINSISIKFLITNNISYFNNTFDDSFGETDKTYHIKKVILDDLYKILIDNINNFFIDNEEITEILNDSKYKLSFIESNLNLLEDTEYLSSNLMSNFNGITTNTYNRIKEDLISNIIIKSLACLSTFEEEDLDNDLYTSEIKLYLIVLSSSLTLLEDDTILELLDYFEGTTEEDDYLDEIKDEIYDIFENNNLKDKYKKLSLKI